jgi:DNA-binding NtrC family response regulator
MNVTSAGSVRVLVVEDDREMCQGICWFLRSHGYQVEGVGDGRQALSRLQREEFAAVIADVRLTRSHDLDLVREIQRLEGFRPWVVYTGAPDSAPTHRVEQRGVFCILLKGAPMKELLWSAEEACREVSRDEQARCA